MPTSFRISRALDISCFPGADHALTRAADPIRIISRQEKEKAAWMPCGTRLIRRAISILDNVRTSCPFASTRPCVGLRIALMQRSMVVLPLPFRPINAQTSPCFTFRLASFNTGILSYPADMFSTAKLTGNSHAFSAKDQIPKKRRTDHRRDDADRNLRRQD